MTPPPRERSIAELLMQIGAYFVGTVIFLVAIGLRMRRLSGTLARAAERVASHTH